MIVGTAAEGPVIFSFALADGQVVDAGDAAAHVALLVKFPVLVAVGAKPVFRIIVPFVGEADGDAISLKSPKLFDEAIVQFLVPLAGQEFNDGVASSQELGAVAPDAVDGVGEGDTLGVAGVPGVFGEARFLRGSLSVEGRQGWFGRFHIVNGWWRKVAWITEVATWVEDGMGDETGPTPHPGPMTLSLPLVRPAAGLRLRRIPFIVSQTTQVPAPKGRGEGEVAPAFVAVSNPGRFSVTTKGRIKSHQRWTFYWVFFSNAVFLMSVKLTSSWY